MAEATDVSPSEDARYMRRALFLARQGRTHPNPMVGAVIVNDGRIVGEGYHKGVGTPHAETAAFAVAGNLARGATIYVSLEPCSFTVDAHGASRIPCSHRCLAAGVRRVVGAMRDPDPRVSGEGFSHLREAGVIVDVGVEEERARSLNAAFVRHRVSGLPYITHKAAITLDGKIAAAGGDSRWITGAGSRAHVHRLRDRADVLVTGIGTVLADNPSLTTRLEPAAGNGRDPLRVIIDSRLRLPVDAQVAQPGTLVLTVDSGAVGHRRRALEAAGVEVATVRADESGRVSVLAAAELLAGRGLLDVLLECGGELASSFWQAGLVNKALFFVAPKVVGGRDAATAIEGNGFRLMSEALLVGKLKVRRFGRDVALESEIER